MREREREKGEGSVSGIIHTLVCNVNTCEKELVCWRCGSSKVPPPGREGKPLHGPHELEILRFFYSFFFGSRSSTGKKNLRFRTNVSSRFRDTVILFLFLVFYLFIYLQILRILRECQCECCEKIECGTTGIM